MTSFLNLQPYSCPDKLSIIRNGLKKFEPKNKIEKKKRGGKKSKKVLEEEEKEKAKDKSKGGMFDLRAR